MKPKYLSTIAGVIILMILAIYSYNYCKQAELDKTTGKLPFLPAKELFVPINADTLDLYLKKHFNRGNLKTSNKSANFTIKYNPNAYILLHANSNNITETRNILTTAKIKGFSIQYTEGSVQITMNKNGDYVDCPALIVAEILRKNNNQ